MLEKLTSIAVRLEDGALKTFEGREAWTLGALITAGAKGCTPLQNPAPRWSHYVFMLRRAGLDIATIDETHGGPYSGRHGRYVLKTVVEIVSKRVAA